MAVPGRTFLVLECLALLQLLVLVFNLLVLVFDFLPIVHQLATAALDLFLGLAQQIFELPPPGLVVVDPALPIRAFDAPTTTTICGPHGLGSVIVLALAFILLHALGRRKRLERAGGADAGHGEGDHELLHDVDLRVRKDMN